MTVCYLYINKYWSFGQSVVLLVEIEMESNLVFEWSISPKGYNMVENPSTDPRVLILVPPDSKEMAQQGK